MVDLHREGAFEQALTRCGREGEIIISITDSNHLRWIHNLLLNLESLDLLHALVIADSAATCAALVDRMPQLKVIFEHITTMQAVSFVESAGPNVAATITPQHLHINRNDILVGGIRPHMYCLPVAKREQHRLALRGAATSGSAKYFLGTDSAPHHRHDKESDCGCAGIFSAPFALESYIQVFDDEDALGNFEAFASLNGPNFYGMAPNEERIYEPPGGGSPLAHLGIH